MARTQKQITGIGIATVVLLAFAAIQVARRETVELWGEFHPLQGEGSGKVTILANGNGRHYLKLNEVKTRTAGDLQLRLIAAGNAMDTHTVFSASFVDLGTIHTQQNRYEIPDRLNLKVYRAAVILSPATQKLVLVAPLMNP